MYIHDGYNCLPSRSAFNALAHGSPCRSRLPRPAAAVLHFSLHAFIFPSSSPLLATALRVLCEDGLVGLGQVLDLALLAVL